MRISARFCFGMAAIWLIVAGANYAIAGSPLGFRNRGAVTKPTPIKLPVLYSDGGTAISETETAKIQFDSNGSTVKDIASFASNGVVKSKINFSGNFLPETDATVSIGGTTRRFGTAYLIVLANKNNNAMIQVGDETRTTYVKGQTGIDIDTILSSFGNLLTVKNNTTPKATIDYNGAYMMVPLLNDSALPTCSTGSEGKSVTIQGSATQDTKICICIRYQNNPIWVNVFTDEAIPTGTSSTCPNSPW